MTNNINIDKKNPCRSCSLHFLCESYEDCTFCAIFEEACIYNGYKVDDFIPNLKD